MVGVVLNAVDAAALSLADGGMAAGRGAIIGAMLLAAALLAVIALLRKSAAAWSGLMLVGVAGGLLVFWLGILPPPAAAVTFLLQGALAAAALIFLSATIGAVSRNQLLGGVLFAGALSIIGIGVINAALGGEASGLQRLGIAGVAATAIVVSAIAGLRGDAAARLILPGAVLAALAPTLLGAGATGLLALAPQAVFAAGVLCASLAALAEFSAAPLSAQRELGAASQFGDHARQPAPSPAIALRVSENQLAQVLDYAGVAVWDWNRSGGHQTGSFAALMGADSNAAFTPDAFRAFVHEDDVARFDEKIFGAAEGDGGFDEMIRLLGGRNVRLRGARAVDPAGALERIVVFLEESSAVLAEPTSRKTDALKLAAASLTGAAAALSPAPAPEKPVAEVPARKDFAAAIESGEVVAAFQPIICFDDGKVCGAEALARWPAAGESSEKATSEIVRKAQLAGKSRQLSSIMMRAAAKHAAERIGAGEKKYFAAFNVSLSQVRDEDFIEDVRLAIGDHKLPPGALVLELTEGERLVETPKINETFKKLKSAGAALAYDDFGAGFSSLSNLHKYDFDYLKIDKSFIDDIVANGGKKKIVSALARLGRDFGMIVIAEGVETKEAAEIAKAIGCRMGQGYYLGAPLIAAAPLAEGATAAGPSAAPDLASIEVVKPDAEELLLDRSLEADKPAGRPFRRRLFGRS